jgi:P27 family predicted phage terminase small subunit
MGRRGPPPKPTRLKILQGNPGKRALNKDEPTPPAAPGGEVKPPWWLPRYERDLGVNGRKVRSKARTFWARIAPILDEMGVLTTADPDALAMLCDVLAEYVEAREIVRRYGMSYESYSVKADTRAVLNAEQEPDEDEDPLDPNAVTMMIRPRPEVRIASDAWRRARAMMQEFGLTPSARTRVKGDPKTDEDEFDAFMRGPAGKREA